MPVQRPYDASIERAVEPQYRARQSARISHKPLLVAHKVDAIAGRSGEGGGNPPIRADMPNP